MASTYLGQLYEFWIGQDYGDYYGYQIFRSFVYFDTSAIPALATIDSAALSLKLIHDFSNTTDFNVTIQSGMPTYPHDPLVTGDFYYNWYSGDGGSRNTTELGADETYWNITMSETGLTYIQQGGTTKLCLRSSDDINSIAPANGSSSVCFHTLDSGDGPAILYVTYTISTENMYVYNIYGPYLDSPTGTVYNGYVNVTVYPSYNDTQSFLLNGTGGSEDSEVFYFEQQPIMMTWNVSDSGNYSRVIYFTEDMSEDFYIFVPNPDVPFYYYSFNIIDLQGITGGYLESRVYLNGEYRIVERQTANSINALPFLMQWSVIYRMRVVCDQGTLSVGDFTALNEASQNVIIAYGSFPTTTYGFNATVACLRINSTLIQMNYTDLGEATIWVNVAISHRVGNAQVADYSENNTDNTVQVNWNSADPATDYRATVTFYRNDAEHSYIFACPAPADSMANPFGFIGAPYCYGIGISLTLCIGLVASYATITAGAWAMVGLAAFFTWVGWLPQTTETWVIVAFGGLIAGLITIAEWKKTEREI